MVFVFRRGFEALSIEEKCEMGKLGECGVWEWGMQGYLSKMKHLETRLKSFPSLSDRCSSDELGLVTIWDFRHRGGFSVMAVVGSWPGMVSMMVEEGICNMEFRRFRISPISCTYKGRRTVESLLAGLKNDVDFAISHPRCF